MNSKTKQAINRIQELQFSFAKKLSTLIKELRSATDNIVITASPNTENNAAILKNTHDLAHKLAGSAGTFQFTEVSNQAKKLENLCAQLLDDNRFYPKDWASQVQQLLIAIEQASYHKAQTLSLPEVSLPLNKPIVVENEIILVDDDELVSGLIQQQAKHFGYNITCISNPEDLIIILQKAQPKIILMDIVFPKYGFNGIDLIKQLKTENKIHCPVIFMSNRDDFLARLEAVRAGSSGYIVKPINILDLIEILDKYLYSKKQNNFKALIIDDDPIVADYYQHILQIHQFDCESVSQPLKAIEKLLNFQPDIILLDINMPECDGFEMAEVIRQDNRFTHIPILFLTGDTENEIHVEALKAGGDYFLSKNVNKETFIANVISHSQRSKELNNAIKRLRKDEIRFQAVSHSSSDAIITLNKKGLIILWNQGAENIFGYQAIEVIGHSIEIIIPPESQEKHRKGFNKLVKNDSSLSKHSIESQAITKGQKLISIELTYTEWKSGNERFFTSIIRDISHRKLIESELKSQQENLNAIINNSAEGIITIDSRGTIEMVNPKLLKIFNYAAEELIGQNISILMPAEIREQHQHFVNHSEIHATKIINQARELEGLRKGGSLFPMELNVSPMTINGVKKYVGILHDITERQKNLDEITTAKFDAEQANKAKSQFLSSMSHELRTPLNAILGFTQILQEDKKPPLNEDQKDSLDHIFTAGKNLLHLIDEVLDLSKIEHGKVNLKLEKINLVQIINKALQLLKPQAQRAGIQLQADLPNESCFFVNADSFRLNQVISNLLTNAIKYNKVNGIISVWLTETKGRVRFYVKDTGLGIPDTLMADLFKPFNRLGAEQSEVEGTGIGLTITKMLVEMMGGDIGVESSSAEGCTFWVELKKAETLSIDSKITSSSLTELSSAVSIPPSVISILYIEDNSANRLLMEKIITTRTSFHYHEAYTANEGISAALKLKPHVIFLDINLPDMDGFEVFAQLQKHNITATSKVIIVSANAMPEDILKTQGVGFFEYLTKPIDQNQLLAILNQALELS